ncbi:condensation domain-containing protein, partial [Immundisolibacter sp.]|uniref:condensation domain-containing protein n=1 Tax=Immundisolibacter sp. TaxID=1934948 RepID=UPI0035647AC4
VVVLERLPLTANGKLDRKALPAPEGDLQRPYEAPQSDLERQLAAIWSEVLGIERIGRHDNFFDLGGHSLLAVRVIGEILTRLGTQLQLRDMFEAPCIAQLAQRLEAAQVSMVTSLPRIVRSKRVGPRPLSFGQERLWFLNELAAHQPGSRAGSAYNMSGALSLRGPLSVSALTTAFEWIVRRHEILRTAFFFHGSELLQAVREPGRWSLPFVDLSGLTPQERSVEIERWKRDEAGRAFDLVRRADRTSRRTQLLRTRLLRLGRNEHLLIVTMHHIVADLWSLDVLLSNLRSAYSEAMAGRSRDLPALPIQYSDYACWQRASVDTPAYQQQLDYWKQKLAGLARLELPTDFPRPAVQSFSGATVGLHIDATTSERLRALARAHHASPYMVLLAGLTLLLNRYSGQTDIVVGTVVANRNRPEVEPLVGFFVNTLAVRTDLDGDPSFSSLLAQVRNGVLDAQANQDVPFDHLVADLDIPLDLSSSPIFQAIFVMEDDGYRRDTALTEDLSVSLEPIATGTAKFDLQFTLRDTADGIEGEVEFATDLFQAPGAGTSGATLIERLVGHYVSLLKQIALQADVRVSTYAMLTPAERDQQLTQWNPAGELAWPDRGVVGW